MKEKMLNKFKRCGLIFLSTLLIFSAINCINFAFNSERGTAHGDDLVFHYIAPAKQKTYKKIASYSGKVKTLKRMNKKIMAVSSSVGRLGSILGVISYPPATFVGKVLGGGGAAVYMIANAKAKKLSKLKKNTRWHEKIEFKWKRSNRMPYIAGIRLKSWYTYKGKRVGKARVRYQTRVFSYGERWY